MIPPNLSIVASLAGSYIEQFRASFGGGGGGGGGGGEALLSAVMIVAKGY